MSLEMLSRFLDADEGENETGDGDNDNLFNVAIATIFAREVLEGAVIIGQYRTVIQKSAYMDDDFKKEALKAVTVASTIAVSFAALVVIAVAIPLCILSHNLDEHIVAGIEGASKMVAAICVLQLSLKMPVWMQVYKKVSLLPWKKYDPTKTKNFDQLTLKEIHFNIVWNIWRETAECGVFLIPFFIGTGAKAIPISALVGIAISLVLGIGIYIANNRMQRKFWLVFFMAGLTLFLSIGMFVGGCHEFEEVFGSTKEVWSAENEFFSSSNFPFVLLKPFGYSSTRTVLQIVAFWSWLFLGILLHGMKIRATQKVIAEYGDDDDKASAEESGAASSEEGDSALKDVEGEPTNN